MDCEDLCRDGHAQATVSPCLCPLTYSKADNHAFELTCHLHGTENEGFQDYAVGLYLERGELVALLLETADDLAHQVALHAIRLDHYVRALHFAAPRGGNESCGIRRSEGQVKYCEGSVDSAGQPRKVFKMW